MKRRGLARRSRLLATLAAAAILAAAPVARADPRVALIRPANGDATVREATTRMRAELRAAGFEVVDMEAGSIADPRALVERAAATQHPFATVLILPATSGAAAEVWVADHLTSKTLVRKVVARPARGTRPPTALALRALELLRASLLEVEASAPAEEGTKPAVPPEVTRWMAKPAAAEPEPAPPPAAAVPPPSPPPPAPAPPAPPAAAPPSAAAPVTPAETMSPVVERGGKEEPAADEGPAEERPSRPWAPWMHRVGLEAGAGVLYGAGGLGASFGPLGRAWVHVTDALSVRLSFLGPTFGDDVRAPAGAASVRQELFTVGAAYVVRLPVRALAPVLSAGVGGYHLGAWGSARAPAVATYDDVWSALFDVGAGIAFRPVEPIALILDGHALVAIPRPVVAVGDTTVSTGRPAVLGSVTLAASF